MFTYKNITVLNILEFANYTISMLCTCTVYKHEAGNKLNTCTVYAGKLLPKLYNT